MPAEGTEKNQRGGFMVTSHQPGVLAVKQGESWPSGTANSGSYEVSVASRVGDGDIQCHPETGCIFMFFYGVLTTQFESFKNASDIVFCLFDSLTTYVCS